jgi:hemoglobin/transferrin/lactoferrin receptor protein
MKTAGIPPPMHPPEHGGGRAPSIQLAYLVGCALLVADSAGADDDLLSLDQLVVTATRVETSLMNSPAATWTMDREEIERHPVATPAELLQNVPGVFLADGTVPGLPRLRIRGEDPRRSLILIDGQEISDHSTFGPPILIDPSQIERIELVRGAHSALYGSRAAGGVLNVITRRADEEGIHGGSGTAFTGATDGYRTNLWVGGREGPWSFRVAAAATDDSDRRTPSGILPHSSFQSDSLSGQIGWSEGKHDLRFAYDLYHLSSEAPPRTDLPPIFTKLVIDFPKRDREKFAFFYEGTDLLPHLTKLQVNAFYQAVDREFTQEIAGLDVSRRPPRPYDYFTQDEDTIDSAGLNLQSDWALGEQHVVVAGANLLRDELDKQNRRTSRLLPAPAVSLNTAAEIFTTAAYIHDTWSPNNCVELSAGLRHYRVDSELTATSDPALSPRSDDDSATVGSLAAVYRPHERVALRASWGQGYVYPTLLQLHTGSLVGTGGITRPNPGLEAEASENFEIGVRYEDEIISADLTAFYTEAKDYIALVDGSEVPQLGLPTGEQTYANLDGATSHGIEALVEVRVPDTGFEFYAQGTWLHRELEFSTFTTADSGLPRLSGRTGVRYAGDLPAGRRWHLDAYIAAGGESIERTSRTTITTGSWATLNLACGVSFEHGWIGVEFLNINNEEYRPSTDQLTQAGRHVTVSGRLRF